MGAHSSGYSDGFLEHPESLGQSPGGFARGGAGPQDGEKFGDRTAVVAGWKVFAVNEIVIFYRSPVYSLVVIPMSFNMGREGQRDRKARACVEKCTGEASQVASSSGLETIS